MAPTDYSKKKNDELSDLLKTRSLPHTGKKAELIARLQQYDKDHPGEASPPSSTPSAPPTAAVAAAAAAPGVTEDEIDWDDDGGAGLGDTMKASEAGGTAIAAGGQGRVDNPVSVPNQAVDIDPSTTADLTIKGGENAAVDKDGVIATSGVVNTDTATTSAEAAAAPAPAVGVDFSKGIATTDIDTELAKRKSRATRFGIAAAETDEEAVKALERAKRFGTTSSKEGVEAVKGLDEALPERGRKRGRGGDRDGEEEGRGGKRRDGGRRGGAGGGRRNGGDRGAQSNGGGGGRAGRSTLSEKDRLAAESRKKRFATAA
ncbi:MAG: hypothetical protein M1830_001007 [Pleopsidium flavum]|nr:MAG: hypothetical protein M1830_001007 [Pleopsidium flavum]